MEQQRYRDENCEFIREKNMKYNKRYETDAYHGTSINDPIFLQPSTSQSSNSNQEYKKTPQRMPNVTQQSLNGNNFTKVLKNIQKTLEELTTVVYELRAEVRNNNSRLTILESILLPDEELSTNNINVPNEHLFTNWNLQKTNDIEMKDTDYNNKEHPDPLSQSTIDNDETTDNKKDEESQNKDHPSNNTRSAKKAKTSHKTDLKTVNEKRKSLENNNSADTNPLTEEMLKSIFTAISTLQKENKITRAMIKKSNLEHIKSSQNDLSYQRNLNNFYD